METARNPGKPASVRRRVYGTYCGSMNLVRHKAGFTVEYSVQVSGKTAGGLSLIATAAAF